MYGPAYYLYGSCEGCPPQYYYNYYQNGYIYKCKRDPCPSLTNPTKWGCLKCKRICPSLTSKYPYGNPKYYNH